MIRSSSATALAALAGLVLFLVPACRAPEAGDVTSVEPSGNAAEQALARSITFHDPEGAWASARFELDLEEARPDGTVRRTGLRFDNGAGRFDLTRQGPERLQEVTVTGDEVDARLDGSRDIPPEAAQAMRLTAEAARTTRDYYLYLYGLPMKLRDPGTILDPEVETAELPELGGEQTLRLKVTYDPEVGGDTWYFHLDPETYALRAYRFYHDESKNDGELIVLEGLSEVGSMRLPRERTWTVNEDGRLLGTDTIAAARTLGEG